MLAMLLWNRWKTILDIWHLALGLRLTITLIGQRVIVTIQKRKSIFEKLENLNILFPFTIPSMTLRIQLRPTYYFGWMSWVIDEYWRIYVLEIDKETVLLRRDRKQCEIRRLSFINLSRQGRFTTKGGLREADGSISPLSKRKD